MWTTSGQLIRHWYEFQFPANKNETSRLTKSTRGIYM